MWSRSDMDSTEKLISPRKSTWSRRRKLLIGGGITLVLIIALAIGLGVGLTRASSDDDSSSSDDSGSGSNSTTSGDNGSNTNSTQDAINLGYLNAVNYTNSNLTYPDDPDSTGDMWKPAVGLTWQYVLRSPLTSTLPNNTQVWDIDVFDNTRSTITGLQQHGAKVICYFSAGSYENWRVDKYKFQPSDLGNDLDGWPGEKWLNISSPNVKRIMLGRLDMAVQKGCNGVDPDNMDGYDNDNGLGLTQAQSVAYAKWLANSAHARGLSIGLKNAGAIIPQVISYMQWSVNEQCVQYSECDTYAPFIKAGKPVFHVEYPKGDDTNNNVNVDASTVTKLCDNAPAAGFSTIIKNMDLDLWEQTCPSS